MRRFNFNEFVAEVKDLGLLEMIRATEAEAASIDERLYRHRGARGMTRAAGGVEYRRRLSGFLFLLRSGRFPAGVSDLDFSRMWPAIEGLVNRGDVAAEDLVVFGVFGQV